MDMFAAANQQVIVRPSIDAREIEPRYEKPWPQ